MTTTPSLREIVGAVEKHDKALEDMRTIEEKYPIDRNYDAIDTDKSILRARDEIKGRYHNDVRELQNYAEDYLRALLPVVECVVKLESAISATLSEEWLSEEEIDAKFKLLELLKALDGDK